MPKESKCSSPRPAYLHPHLFQLSGWSLCACMARQLGKAGLSVSRHSNILLIPCNAEEDGCEVVLMRKYDAGGMLRAVTQYVYPTVDMLADTLSSG